MPVIKRYPNRKLYDTAAKKYVSLEQVAGMIRGGESIQVVDHNSGDDLTAVVLTQIIVEQERRGGGRLPLEVLTDLVRAGGKTVAGLRRHLSAPLELFRQVDDEILARISELVATGELGGEDGRWLGQKLLDHSGAPTETSEEDDAVVQALQSRGLPTREEIAQWSDLLDDLSAEVDRLPGASIVNGGRPSPG